MAMSEYGRGYITCLFQFANHTHRLDEILDTYAKMRHKDPSSAYLFTEQHAIESWASGASDHFYELIKPKRQVKSKEWLWAKLIASVALDWGHGFRGTTVTVPQARSALSNSVDLAVMALARVGVPYPDNVEDAVLIDQTIFGLTRADAGQWSCSENSKR